MISGLSFLSIIPDSNFFPNLPILQVFVVLKSVFTKDKSYRIVEENIGSLKLEENCHASKGEDFSLPRIIMNIILAATLFAGCFFIFSLRTCMSKLMYLVEKLTFRKKFRVPGFVLLPKLISKPLNSICAFKGAQNSLNSCILGRNFTKTPNF